MVVNKGMGVSGIGLVIGLVFLLSGCGRKTGQESEGSYNVPTARDVTNVPANELVHAAPRPTKREKAPQVDGQVDAKHASKLPSLAEQFEQCEAQLPDIVFPLGLKPLDVTITAFGDYFLAFATHLDLSTIASFYIQEMERMGWKQLSSFEGPELLLVFSKPTKLCTVCVRQGGSKRSKKNKNVSLFVTMRGR